MCPRPRCTVKGAFGLAPTGGAPGPSSTPPISPAGALACLPMQHRAVIADIAQADEDAGAMVTITLDVGGVEHRGAAVGSIDLRDRPRIIGEAALRAVESMSGGTLDLELLAIATAGIGDTQVAVAQVKLNPFEEVLVGSAMLNDDDDPAWAAARAVMDALNRRLSALL